MIPLVIRTLNINIARIAVLMIVKQESLHYMHIYSWA